MTNVIEHMTCQNSVMTLLFSYVLVEVQVLFLEELLFQLAWGHTMLRLLLDILNVIVHSFTTGQLMRPVKVVCAEVQ